MKRVPRRPPFSQAELHFADADDGAGESGKPWTVSRLNREVRTCLEGKMGTVWVEGEISNLRLQPSGHRYFSLKDATAQVSCVMFRGSTSAAPDLRDGMHVEATGDVTLYEARGQYQIVVRRMQARGAGELEARLRALQEKLRAEGLFEQSRKKALPPHPVRVGVVTSPAGAAIRDFLHVLRRRAPHIEVFIAPVRVQGAGAAREIAGAIGGFGDTAHSGFPDVDVIVVTRGGGSLEDLWEFNEECVARAIAASSIPVISAVGHETDVTTSDLAADVRAPTPSAAAEILSADRTATLERLALLLRRLGREAAAHLVSARSRLANRTVSGVFQLPARRIADLSQTTDDLRDRAELAVSSRMLLLREAWQRARAVLRARSPSAQVSATRSRLSELQSRQIRAAASGLSRRSGEHARHVHALGILGPRQTLARGFTITMDARHQPLVSAAEAARETEIVTLFADGEIKSTPQK
ncbi:MAG: exodeoxyribonuclease VII large subunit [Chthoniobacterales bacterium]|nr:exodeoxyribonuclease VII large subunit [Chthoniobacterales bacterium]